jgi:hypothetical protein
VCTLAPNDWQRRRWAFLAMVHGAPSNVFARVKDIYPIFRNIVYFL